MAEQVQYTPNHWSWQNPISPLEDAIKLFVEDKRQKEQIKNQADMNKLKSIDSGLMSLVTGNMLASNDLYNQQYGNKVATDEIESKIEKIDTILRDDTLRQVQVDTANAMANKSSININGVNLVPSGQNIAKKYHYDVDENDPLTVKYWEKGKESDPDAWLYSVRIDGNGRYGINRNSQRYDSSFYNSLQAADFADMTISAPLMIKAALDKKKQDYVVSKKDTERSGNKSIFESSASKTDTFKAYLEQLQKTIIDIYGGGK